MARNRESIEVLQECIELQERKGRDYQNPLSTIRQADHYPNGVQTIMDMVHQKLMRYRSLSEAAQVGGDGPNYESMEDTIKDMINYASFAVSYMRGKMDGQVAGRNMFNRPYPTDVLPATPDSTPESEK